SGSRRSRAPHPRIRDRGRSLLVTHRHAEHGSLHDVRSGRQREFSTWLEILIEVAPAIRDWINTEANRRRIFADLRHDGAARVWGHLAIAGFDQTRHFRWTAETDAHRRGAGDG